MIKIGDLAKRTGVSTDTLRLYEKRGLIRSERMANGHRVFDPQMERLVNLIRLGQGLGFTLKDMESVTTRLNNGSLSTEDTAALIQERIVSVDQKLSELAELRAILVDFYEQACPLKG